MQYHSVYLLCAIRCSKNGYQKTMPAGPYPAACRRPHCRYSTSRNMMQFHRDIMSTFCDEKTFQASRSPTLSNPFDLRRSHFCKVMTTKGWFNPNGNIQLGYKRLFQAVCASKKDSEIALCSHGQHCDRAGHASKR